MTERYSPKDVEKYAGPSRSLILNADAQAWNLAYLSYDFEAHVYHPDPHFAVHVRRTLQFVLMTGELDLSGNVPMNLTVRGLLTRPAPYAARQILRMKRHRELALHQAYGSRWLVTLDERSHKFVAPYDPAYDAPVVNVDLALQALARHR